ncbi:hypothetical protein PAXRUDRAFT_590347 [Paxillus rubicundulus Ve08.2h10]|uniref:Uncharacterized protein n=1 Tax=Paxillus rubicundulus Ve08.2h10 TaxID=930991 RepID=A0A0D0D5Y9_9AGAM|nr:hypothetical protein PAXRUDRAFT_590347 [Paxillus rubicundulus Ve08.2h10]
MWLLSKSQLWAGERRIRRTWNDVSIATTSSQYKVASCVCVISVKSGGDNIASHRGTVSKPYRDLCGARVTKSTGSQTIRNAILPCMMFLLVCKISHSSYLKAPIL